MSATPTTRVPCIFGAGAFGKPNTFLSQIYTIPEAQAVVDIFRAHGQKAFDTSNFYGGGSSEEFLGQLDLKGGVVDTKVYPATPGDHAPAKLRASVEKAVKTLGANGKINILYLHAPDRTVPYIDTLREINELYKEGLFKEFGLSRYPSWEVAEIYIIAKLNGWVLPTVYQGMYNAVQRGPETDLFPCLRNYRIRFYAHGPLGAGILTGSVLKEEDMHRTDGSRWDERAFPFTENIRKTFRPLLPVVNELNVALKAHGISFPAAALRWLQHHSALTPSDGVLFGAKNTAQTEGNLTDSERGPLPDDVVQLLDDAWKKAKAAA